MSIVPKWPFVVAALVVGLGVGAAGMAWWDAGEIGDLEQSIAKTKVKTAEGIALQYKQAADDLAKAATTIKDAAAAGSTDISALNAKLDTINRSIKNAKPPALPVDCKPGAVRVRNLSEAASALDQAIARSVPSQ